MKLVHIAKCAGTELGRQLGEVVTTAKFITGESCIAAFAGDGLRVTMLRSPRSHVLSQFDHMRHVNKHPQWANMISPRFPHTPLERTLGFSTWLLHHARRDKQLPDAACSRAWERDWSSSPPRWDRSPFECVEPADFNGYNPNNMQSRHMLCTHRTPMAGHHVFSDTGYTPNATAAVQAMYSLHWVGLVELYPESLCLFKARWTGSVPAECRCSDHESLDAGSRHKRHSSLHGSNDPLLTDPDIVKMIDSVTAVDRQLYRAAVDRVLASIRLTEKASGVQILCKERLAAFHNATRYVHSNQKPRDMRVDSHPTPSETAAIPGFRSSSGLLRDPPAQPPLPLAQSRPRAGLKTPQLYVPGTNESQLEPCHPPSREDWLCYLRRYPDLRQLFEPDENNTVVSACSHWADYGRHERRNPYCTDQRDCIDAREAIPDCAGEGTGTGNDACAKGQAAAQTALQGPLRRHCDLHNGQR